MRKGTTQPSKKRKCRSDESNRLIQVYIFLSVFSSICQSILFYQSVCLPLPLLKKTLLGVPGSKNRKKIRKNYSCKSRPTCTSQNRRKWQKIGQSKKKRRNYRKIYNTFLSEKGVNHSVYFRVVWFFLPENCAYLTSLPVKYYSQHKYICLSTACSDSTSCGNLENEACDKLRSSTTDRLRPDHYG